MPKPVKKALFNRLISALVIVALLATVTRLVYYTIYWRDLASAAADFSWLEWAIVALFVVALGWKVRRGAKLD